MQQQIYTLMNIKMEKQRLIQMQRQIHKQVQIPNLIENENANANANANENPNAYTKASDCKCICQSKCKIKHKYKRI